MRATFTAVLAVILGACATVPREAVVKGSLDKNVIRGVIAENREPVQRCFEAQLTKEPALEGKIAVRFRIAPSGAVSAEEVVQSSVSNPEFENCVVAVVAAMKFPAPKGGGEVIVTYPFILKQLPDAADGGAL